MGALLDRPRAAAAAQVLALACLLLRGRVDALAWGLGLTGLALTLAGSARSRRGEAPGDLVGGDRSARLREDCRLVLTRFLGDVDLAQAARELLGRLHGTLDLENAWLVRHRVPDPDGLFARVAVEPDSPLPDVLTGADASREPRRLSRWSPGAGEVLPFLDRHHLAELRQLPVVVDGTPCLSLVLAARRELELEPEEEELLRAMASSLKSALEAWSFQRQGIINAVQLRRAA